MLVLAVPATVFLAVLQVSAAPSFTWLGVHPDLLVAWIGCWAMIRGRDETIVLTGVAGLSLGLLAPEPLGASLLALMPLCLVVLATDLPALSRGFPLTLAIVFVAGLLYPILLAIAGLAGGDSFGPPLGVLRIAPRVAILDVATAALLYWPLRPAGRRRKRVTRFAGA